MVNYYDKDCVSDEQIISNYRAYIRSLGNKVDPEFANLVLSDEGLRSGKIKVYRELWYEVAAKADIEFSIGYSSSFTTQHLESVTYEAQRNNWRNETKIVATPNIKSHTSHQSDTERFSVYNRSVCARCIYKEIDESIKYSGVDGDIADNILKDDYPSFLYSKRKPSFCMSFPQIDCSEYTEMRSAMKSKEAIVNDIREKKKVAERSLKSCGFKVEKMEFKESRFLRFDESSMIGVLSVRGYNVAVDFKGIRWISEFGVSGEIENYSSSGRYYPQNKVARDEIESGVRKGLRPLDIWRKCILAQVILAGVVGILGIVLAILESISWYLCVVNFIIAGIHIVLALLRAKDIDVDKLINRYRGSMLNEGVDGTVKTIKGYIKPSDGVEWWVRISPVLSWVVPLIILILAH